MYCRIGNYQIPGRNNGSYPELSDHECGVPCDRRPRTIKHTNYTTVRTSHVIETMLLKPMLNVKTVNTIRSENWTDWNGTHYNGSVTALLHGSAYHNTNTPQNNTILRSEQRA